MLPIGGLRCSRSTTQNRPRAFCSSCACATAGPLVIRNVYRLRFLLLSDIPIGAGMYAGICGAGATGSLARMISAESFLMVTPMCRPYRPFRPLPSSSLTHPSTPIPASRQRPQGRCRSQPFLLLRQRWQRGLAERSSSSGPSGRSCAFSDAFDALRE